MTSMRACVLERFGGPEVLEFGHRPIPVPDRGEVRVKVHAFGINRADVLQRRGMYPAPPDAPQDIPGLEYAGEVDAVADDVRRVGVGDRVMGIVGGGAYAEYVTVPASHVVSVPPGRSFVDAAAIPEAFITAYDALERLGVVSGEWLLVHAVGSGVGTAALQLAHHRGARCIGTSRTAAKLEVAKTLGLEFGVQTTKRDWVQTAREISGDAVRAALDLVGGELFSATLDLLANRGRLVLVGITAGRRADVDLAVILRRRLSIEGTVLRSRSKGEKAAVIQSFCEHVLHLFAENHVRPVIDSVFPFERIAEAHAYMESNASFGKIVVKVA